MASRFTRELGAIEAQNDDNFEAHFIEVHNLEKIIDNDSDIVYGTKGSGKTALCKALTELNNDKYFICKIIDLDSISFKQVHAALQQLKDTTKKEVVKLASDTWRNVLLIYGLEAIGTKLTNDNPLKQKIENIVSKGHYNNPKSNSRLVTFIQNLLIKIKNIGLEDNEESPLGLTTKQLDEIDKTYDDEISDIILEVSTLFSKNKKVLLCLDGFDTIIEHTKKSRIAIFSGLTDAIYKCSKDKIISGIFCIKVFLPKELTDDVTRLHFDADKFIFNTHYLNWSSTELEKLIVKRLTRFSRTKSQNFKDVWSEFMPDKVVNPVHNVEENTFEYILRHTLYRPRQLLIQIQVIFEEWDKRYTSTKIDPSFIPKTVSDTNLRLAKYLTSELEYTIPGITQFLHSFNGLSNTILLNSFREKIKRMFDIQTHLELSDLFDKIYNNGIIGYAKNTQTSTGINNFFFAYINAGLGFRKVYNSLENNDIIALSPILNEFCGCKNSDYGIVSQKEITKK